MPHEGSGAPPRPPDPEQVLREGRARFVASFPRQIDRIEQLLDDTAAPAREELRRLVHRIAGFAGTVGLPAVGARAAALEPLLADPAIDVVRARDVVGTVREAFARDLASHPHPGSQASGSPAGLRDTEGRMDLHILMAEDDPDIQLVAGMALRKAGFTVTIVSTGLELLGQIRDVKPDVVLLDWMMPELDGPDTLARLREDEATRDLPVIFMTAKSQGFEVERGLKLGAAGYIIKPFDALTLGTQVKAILGS